MNDVEAHSVTATLCSPWLLVMKLEHKHVIM